MERAALLNQPQPQVGRGLKSPTLLPLRLQLLCKIFLLNLPVNLADYTIDTMSTVCQGMVHKAVSD